MLGRRFLAVYTARVTAPLRYGCYSTEGPYRSKWAPKGSDSMVLQAKEVETACCIDAFG